MEKHSNNLEKRGSKIGQVNRQLRRSYDANFKMMVINEAESSNNCQVAVKYGVTECNVRRWRTQKDRLKKAHSERKSFRGPQSGRFQELDRRVSAYVDERRKDGRPVSRAVVQLKAVETAKELNIPNADFKASLGWCKRMMRRHGLTLRRRTGPAQRLPSDSGEKLSSSQRHVINSRKKHSYPPDQVGNADQTPVFFDMPTPVTVHEEASPQPVMCQVCGTYFETRRGLSSHARLHLRQLGVTLSESSGAPIELLYQLIQERDGSLADFKADSSTPVSTPLKNAVQQESPPSAPDDKGSSFKAAVSVTTTPQRSDHQGSPVKLKEPAATLLPSSPSSLRLIEGSSSSSAEHQTPAKPLWAPLETDAPITLDTHDEVHVCQLCGCWYETRKGLSSHARAHLRQIGIPDSDIKGSPIYFLYQIMVEGNLKPISSKQQVPPNTNSPTGSLSGRSTDLSSPPASPPVKRPKTSEDCTCVLCGEEFENRKGLASHARSHLRQMGVTDLMGKSSAINTLQELVSSGMVEAVHPPRTSSPPSSSAAPSTAPAASPAQSQSPFPSTSLTPSPAKSVHSPPTPVNRAPKAKKGFRLAVDPLHKKLKPEPVEIELSVQPKESSTISDSALEKSPSAAAAATSASAAAASKPLSAVSSTDVPSPPTVLCDFCGQLFETRKALSCHVRAHLRQLGLTWSIRTSPIDLLKEVMLHGEDGRKWSSPAGKGTWTPQGSKKATDQPQPREPAFNNCTSPLDYSLKEKSSPGKRGSTHTDTSCELCGFDFENRKALASHARAHLRQLGIIEWKADGASSPIDLLSELIRKDPAKVAAINRRYRMGDLYIKKSQRSAASPSLSTDSDTVPGGSLRPEHKAGREDSAFAAGSSRQPQGHARTLAGHTQQRGVHPPKHTVPTGEESQDTSSQQPARSGSIPALLPKPPLTPLVKLVGKVYSLKCRFCEEVFHGPVSVQEQWITHLQKHILSLGYKGKASPPAAPVEAPALVVAV